jgi:tetratricopeptide (TPR) repeat protein
MEALDDMKKSLNLNDKYAKGYLRRGGIYMKLENYEQARYDFQKVIDLEPGKIILY